MMLRFFVAIALILALLLSITAGASALSFVFMLASTIIGFKVYAWTTIGIALLLWPLAAILAFMVWVFFLGSLQRI